MSNRERWVVYPLLFFSMLLAGRDDIVPPDPVEHKTLVCNRILVQTPDGRSLVSIGGSVENGVVFVHGPEEAPLIKIGHDDALRASGLLALADGDDPLTTALRGHPEVGTTAYSWQPDADGETVESKEPSDSDVVPSPSVEKTPVENTEP